ncbi:MAG: GTPase obg, partial [Candidatus Pacebacteria bacterium GW2011_GWF1_36_5]
GRGSVHFKSSVKTTPMEAGYGGFGDQKLVQLELKLLADLGLVGFPNAGKSTFLSKVTKANPKIANYPFTTIEPNLGIMYLGSGQSKEELVVADIPGLIEGASKGKGLGLDFLRHIENCKSLMFILYLDEETIFDEKISDAKKAQMLWEQYEQLRKELNDYDPKMLKKRSIVTINKIDIYTPKQIDTFRSYFTKKDTDVILFSMFTNEGLSEVTKAIAKTV